MTDDHELLDRVYLAAFSREPNRQEREALVGELSAAKGDERRQAVEDVYWSVLTSREFLFNH